MGELYADDCETSVLEVMMVWLGENMPVIEVGKDVRVWILSSQKCKVARRVFV